VNKVPLTVTADNKTMVYGAAVPALTWTATGLVNGDATATALTGSPAVKTSATSTWAPGDYVIFNSVGTLAAANYTLVLRPGTLTITPLGTVGNPTFTLPTGTYSGAQSVKINVPSGATVYFTTDGTIPAHTAHSSNGVLYAGSIAVSTTEAIKAIAVRAGYTSSAIASATYTIH
jgi:hypothetical protein